MKIAQKEIFDIIDMSKTKFKNQPARLYWKSEQGPKQADETEMRFVAIIEAIDVILKLDIDIEYLKEHRLEVDDV